MPGSVRSFSIPHIVSQIPELGAESTAEKNGKKNMELTKAAIRNIILNYSSGNSQIDSSSPACLVPNSDGSMYIHI